MALKYEGGYQKRGGIKFETALSDNFFATLDLDANNLNFDKVCVTFGTDLQVVPPNILRIMEYLKEKGK